MEESNKLPLPQPMDQKNKEVVKRDLEAEIRAKREQEVKAFGYANTRKKKRASKRMYESSKKIFDACTTKFVNVFLEEGFDMESEKVKAVFEDCNSIWKKAARVGIQNNIDHYDTSAKRLRYLASFKGFVESLMDKMKNGDN